MSDKNGIRHNEELTKNAKKIFGDDIIAAVYLMIGVYDKNTKESVDELFSYAIRYCTNDETSIDFDGQNILVEFTNGNRVEFGCSEWGHVAKANLNKTYIEM